MPQGIQRRAIELKVWRNGEADPTGRGLGQLTAYLARLGLDNGTLIIFDSRTEAPPLPQRSSREQTIHDGRSITVIKL